MLYINPVAEVPDSWTTKVTFLRDRGAVSASWSEEGDLLAVTLGPAPPLVREPVERVAPKPEDRSKNITRGGSQLVPRSRE